MDRTRHPNIAPTIFVAVSALTGMSAAHAATITQTFDTGQLTTNVVNDPITFADFNTSLGTLTSVVVTLGGSVERDLIFKNTSPNSGATISVTDWNTSFTLTGPSGVSLSAASNATPALSVAAYNAQPGSTTAVDNGTTTTIGNTTFNDAHLAITSGGPGTYSDVATFYNTAALAGQSQTITSGLSNFMGSSTFNANASLSYGATGGNNYSRFATYADGLVTLQYNYTPVPLPAAAWLFLSGVGGLGTLFGRRRNATASRKAWAWSSAVRARDEA
jgi:hypothetical protein